MSDWLRSKMKIISSFMGLKIERICIYKWLKGLIVASDIASHHNNIPWMVPLGPYNHKK